MLLIVSCFCCVMSCKIVYMSLRGDDLFSFSFFFLVENQVAMLSTLMFNE